MNAKQFQIKFKKAKNSTANTDTMAAQAFQQV